MPYIERMIAEADELSERLVKAQAFLTHEVFATLDWTEQGLLNAQIGAMTAYLSALTLRIQYAQRHA